MHGSIQAYAYPEILWEYASNGKPAQFSNALNASANFLIMN